MTTNGTVNLLKHEHRGLVDQLRSWWTESTLTGHASRNEAAKYRACLDAPNFTVFSNTSSAAQWNDDPGSGAVPVVPLESPHNAIHLALGGYDVPGKKVIPGTNDYSPIEGANGDMGENDTAALDPIFYFHHCFVDRMFWLWQKRHGRTDPAWRSSPNTQGRTPSTVKDRHPGSCRTPG